MKRKILSTLFALVLLVALVIPASVALAQPTGTSVVTGNLAPAWVYSISAPANISIGPFTAAGPYTTTGVIITATTDDPGNATVDIGVRDATANAGSLTLGLNSLGTPLEAMGGDILGYTPVSAVDIMLETLEPLVGAGSYIITPNFSIQQTIAPADLLLPPGAYSTILTFTATFQ